MKSPTALRHLVVPLLLVAIFASSYIFLLWWIHGVQLRITEIEDVESASAQKSNRVLAEARFAQNLTSERRALDERFLTQENLVTFLSDIENLGQKSSTTLTIEGVNPQVGFFTTTPMNSTVPAVIATSSVATADNGVSSNPALAMALSITGQWEAVMRAIVLLETLPFAVLVTELNLDADTENTLWNAQVSVIVATRPFLNK